MTKVCYIGVHADGTGYAQAANRTILSLDAVGIEVVPRHIKLATQYIPPPQRVQELEKTGKLDKIDVVIQHVLPHMLVYKAGVKNIGYFHCETSHFKPSGWQYFINLMDEVWVCSKQNKEAAEHSGVTKPIKVVPIPCDPSLYEKSYKPLEINLKGRYAFYYIGDYSSRKNARNLIKTYLSEFDTHDHVVLVLKSYVEGHAAQQSSEYISREIEAIKKELRLHPDPKLYPPIIILPDYLNEIQMYQLHAMCDCFVSMERGAAWNLPYFDALAFDNVAINTGWGGMTEFLPEDELAIPIDYKMISTEGMIHCPYYNLYSGYEQWAEPNFDEFAYEMRKVYENRSKTSIDRSQWRQEWSLKNKGLVLKEML